MNIRTSLLAIAMMSAPLYAQQPVDVYNAIATPAAAVESQSAAARAAALPALSKLPQNVNTWITAGNVGDIITAINSYISGGDGAVKEFTRSLDHVAFGISEGNGELWKFATRLVEYSMVESGELAPLLGSVPGLADELVTEKGQAMAQAFASARLKPVYVVMGLKPGSEALTQEFYDEFCTLVADAPAEEGIYAVEINGMTGLKINLAELAKDIVRDATRSFEFDEETEEFSIVEKPLPPYLKELTDNIAGRTIYLLVKLEGTTVTAVLCEDPADIALPSSPEQSLVATPALAAADSHLSGMLAMGSFGTEAINACQNISNAQLDLAAESFTRILRSVADKDASKAPTCQAAIEGISTLYGAVKALSPDHNSPASFMLWAEDKKLCLETSADACGRIYMPGKFRYTSRATDPNTIMYAESTPTTGLNLPSAESLLTAVTEVGEGMAALSGDMEVAQYIAIYKAFLPDVKNALGIAATAGEGLDGSAAFVVDACGTLPTLLGGKPGNTVEFPRISLVGGVTDRAKLSQAWDDTLSLAGSLMSRFGQDPAMLQMLPILPSAQGAATSYSVMLPVFTPDFGPNLTISDSALAVGTSPKLNAELVNGSTTGTDATGGVFTVKFDRLAATVGSLAAYQQEQADDLTRIAAKGEALTKAAAAKARSTAAEYTEAAQVLKFISTFVPSIDAAATTKDGKSIMRINVNLGM